MHINTFYKIAENLAEYIKKYNLKGMVLGLSGGIDSTLCALICNEVIKQFNDVKLYLISLPSDTNGNDENDIAFNLGNGLLSMNANGKVVFQLWNIENEFNSMLISMQHYCSMNHIGEIGPLQRGNIKARIRMTHLYNIASMAGGIVIDTDNLTENNLGFWTIHGDVGDVKPIGNLWKTEVYELANACLENLDLPEQVKNALQESINITPTDGNGVKVGGDLAQIAPGLTYQDVDKVLKNEVLEYNQERYDESYHQLCDKYTAYLVDGIIKRHKNSAYKRVGNPKKICTF